MSPLILAVTLVMLLVTPGQRTFTRVAVVPRDDGCATADLCEFRKRLLAAVESRDVASVVGAVSSTFNDDPTGETARELRRALERPWSPTWGAIARVLALGGRFDTTEGESFCAPWPHTESPTTHDVGRMMDEAESDGDPWTVIAQSATIHSAPDSHSPALGHVGHELIMINSGAPAWFAADAANKWVAVRWRERVGYLRRNELWSPDDPHLCSRRQGGSWRITDFRDAGGRMY